MGFLRRFGIGAYMRAPKPLNPNSLTISQATYQIVPGDRGLPMVRFDLTFNRYDRAFSNPDMSLVLLIDRSGSMTESFVEGHVLDVASEIHAHLSNADTGYDLVFYDNEPTFAGHIATRVALQQAVLGNWPRSRGTYVMDALRGAVERYRSRRGLYLIVITDGEFSDKNEVQRYVVQTLLPQLTPENPYAFRLHFVGAGEEVDREFLAQLEATAAGQGVQLVKHHHHAHLRHSHEDIIEELSRAFIGNALNATVGDQLAVEQGAGAHGNLQSAITRIGDLSTKQWHEGAVAQLGFLPRQLQLGVEVAALQGQQLNVVIRYLTRAGTSTDVLLQVQLPSVVTPGAMSGPRAPTARPPRLHLPWHRTTPDEEAARAAELQRQAELAQRIEQDHRAALARQMHDLQALGQGGIPSMAQQRIQELRSADPARGIFTSDLSPDEAALLRRNGFRPLGLVCGSAMYHVGTAYASAYADCEVAVLSQAYNEATRLAVGRMAQEANLLGAHGVAGVRFDIVRHEWGEKTIEVQLFGTAIAGPGPAPKTPWLSDLSGQEWYALHRAGYEPVGLVYGHCTWFVLTTIDDVWSERSTYNQELSHFSEALKHCRDRVNGMVQSMARDLQAIGVVGVHLSRRVEEIHLSGPDENPAYEHEHHNVILSLIGTAVQHRPGAPERVRATTQVLSLRDGRLKPWVIHTTAATFE